MDVSRVDNLLDSMRDEESRLRDELAETQKRVKEIKKELDKVLSAIKALGGKQSGGKRRKRNAAKSQSASAASTSASHREDRGGAEARETESVSERESFSQLSFSE